MTFASYSTMTRRRLLATAAGSITVIAAGGLVWRAGATGALGRAEAPYAPWHAWRTERAEGPLALVQAGLLASNAHNAQPWRFEVTQDRIALHADPERNVGALDPFRREMVLSLGCAVENMVRAGRALGWDVTVETRPGTLGPDEGRDGQPACVLRLSPAEPARDALADAIPHRHTNRGPYDRARSIDASLREDMAALSADLGPRLHLFHEEAHLAEISDLVIAATREIVADGEMAEASAEWFRFRKAEVTERRDGITLDGMTLPPLVTAAAKMLPPPSRKAADRQWIKATRKTHTATAPLFGAILVGDPYDRPSDIAAGRLWQRLHLWAAAQGLGAHPLNQVPERIDRARALGRVSRFTAAAADLTGSEAHPTFVFRMGHPLRVAGSSPRRGADAVARLA